MKQNLSFGDQSLVMGSHVDRLAGPLHIRSCTVEFVSDFVADYYT